MCANQWFVARVILQPGASGDVWRCVWRSFTWAPKAGGATGIGWTEPRGAAHHPMMHRGTDAPTTSGRLQASAVPRRRNPG